MCASSSRFSVSFSNKKPVSKKKKKEKKNSIANFGYFLFTYLIKMSGEFYIKRAFIKMNWWKFSPGNMEKSKQFLVVQLDRGGTTGSSGLDITTQVKQLSCSRSI